MYDNEDLERFYFLYQVEILPHGHVVGVLLVSKTKTLYQYLTKCAYVTELGDICQRCCITGLPWQAERVCWSSG